MTGVTANTRTDPLTLDLLEALLEEQQTLPAVDRFVQQQVHDGRHDAAQYYRDLIPAAAPAAGQQYAFEVNLDACSGCKACVTACHSLNDLEEVGGVEMTSARLSGILAYPNDLQIYLGQAVRISGIVLYLLRCARKYLMNSNIQNLAALYFF